MATGSVTRLGAVAPATAPSLRSTRAWARRRAAAVEFVMLAPPLLLVVALVIVPIGIALYLSFTNWDGFTNPPKMVGLRNYEQLAKDPAVLHAALFTVIVTVVGSIGCNVLGLGIALLLNAQTRVNSLLRVLVFSPYVIGPVILGFLWSSILGTNGAVNSALGRTLPFLSDPTWATATVIGVVIWSSFGVNVVLYLSGLQTIPESLIEAARLDGASPWQTFWRVKLPVLAPTVTVNIVLAAIGLLRVYEMILALTAGGPAGKTQSIVYSILTSSFENTQLGYGAAQSIVLMVLIIAVTIGITATRRRSEQAVAA
ncbi:carbohydrate ABC transporter permease [Kutzneria sp. CA-103260]|uniref:carbohydrate ABC transporter permease n=1 Tax=Kutzneria sp. CA-103260 TaxID=2802641 RepID=UPI001BAC2B25|nr:sugar ABC transporter permease [Kutzneria sp. CA-103260]QUQ72472.1 sugar-transporter integral membrane protein [Kutzneria sp. CA-103260]